MNPSHFHVTNETKERTNGVPDQRTYVTAPGITAEKTENVWTLLPQVNIRQAT